MTMPIPDFSLNSLQFDNRFVRELPVDPVTDNSRRQVQEKGLRP